MARVPIFNLFNKVGQCRSAEEVMETGGLNYEVVKRDLFDIPDDPSVDYFSGDYKEDIMPHHVAVVRTDKKGRASKLGCTGRTFGLIQNRDIVDFCKEFTTRGEAEFYAAGAPNYGERIFLIMKQPEHTYITPDDRIDAYFCITSAHDGSGCFHAIPLYLRNANQTVIIPPYKESTLKIKHTKNAMDRVRAARRVFKKMTEYWEEHSDKLRSFASTKLEDSMANMYFKWVIPDSKGRVNTRAENVRSHIYGLYKYSGIGHNLLSCRGTLYGAMCAVVEYAEFSQVVKNSKHKDEIAARIHSRISGSAAELKAKAIKMCVQMQKMGENGPLLIGQ